MALSFPAETYAAVVSFYAIIHVPLAEHEELFHRIARWLRPSGVLLATVGHSAWTGSEDDWLGVPGATMAWSGWGDEAKVRVSSARLAACSWRSRFIVF